MISRIKQLLDWQQLSPTQFADRIGIGRPVISHILSERNKPSLDVVRSIKAAFPEVSTDWLLDGIGTMLTVTAPAPVAPITTLPPLKQAAVPAAPPASSPAPAPLVESARPVAASRPTITRFSVGNPKTRPVLPDPTQPLPVPVPNAAPQLPFAPVPSLASVGEVPTGSIEPIIAPSPPAVAPIPSLAEAFGEPGKAIRRIVIFYRDGSFADYQPEG